MKDRFTLAAQVLLARRLKNLLRVDDVVEIDMSYITCAEYQLFINENLLEQKQVQPAHWTTSQFISGMAKRPITGIRASDAEAFCNWLTQQQITPGFRYRLPLLTEIDKYYTGDKVLGYWCRDRENHVIRGLGRQNWTMWKDNFHESLKQDKSNGLIKLVHALARDLAINSTHISTNDQNQKIEFDFDFVRNCKLDRDLSLALHLASELNSLLSRHINYNFSNTLARALAIAYTRAINRSCNINCSLNLASYDFSFSKRVKLTRNKKRSASYIHVLERALSRSLEHTLEYTEKFDFMFYSDSPDYQENRSCLIWATILCDLLADIYGQFLNRSSPIKKIVNFSIKGQVNFTNDHVTNLLNFRDQINQLYSFFSLIELRQKGIIPAWESIRIVRERFDF